MIGGWGAGMKGGKRNCDAWPRGLFLRLSLFRARGERRTTKTAAKGTKSRIDVNKASLRNWWNFETVRAGRRADKFIWMADQAYTVSLQEAEQSRTNALILSYVMLSYCVLCYAISYCLFLSWPTCSYHLVLSCVILFYPRSFYVSFLHAIIRISAM